MSPTDMKAVVFYGPHSIAIESRPIPKVQHDKDIVVKVSASGLCGSDLHYFRGHEVVDSAGFIMGHEFVGEVVEAGRAVTTVRPGDKVVSPFTVSCGDCFYCKLQNSSRCVHCQVFGSNGLDGAQAEYVRVPLADSTVVRAPPGLSDDALILMADIFPTGFFGARNAMAGLGAQDPTEAVVVVIGCGPVGLCAIVSALEYRPRVVFAIDSVDSRLGLAEKLGARPLDLKKGVPSIISAVQEVTEGRGADAVVEVVGQGPALRTAYDIIRPFGSISSIGAHHSAMPFSATDGYE
uniref:Medium chain reductase/dehydrogenase ucsI n=1 Tax=Acremonium sp. TaxID=2046025 RepID=UCSI_ACRSP|nr:RecName: Full=Medium chain reductase/dehydrogenase ucsI; AltName: Full=UCS1025A pyrrolizidinone biosynthesis cluster protein I [Acremonium sp.]QBC88153.1 UcsI [Acremonium sp.]